MSNNFNKKLVCKMDILLQENNMELKSINSTFSNLEKVEKNVESDGENDS